MSRKLVFGVVAMLMLGMPLHATWQLVALALAFLVIVIGRVRTNAGWRWLGVLVFAQIVTFFGLRRSGKKATIFSYQTNIIWRLSISRNCLRTY